MHKFQKLTKFLEFFIICPVIFYILIKNTGQPHANFVKVADVVIFPLKMREKKFDVEEKVVKKFDIEK